MSNSKVIFVCVTGIFSIALPFVLHHVYDDYFHEYYIHGFLAGLGPFMAAAGMLLINLALLSPILYVLRKKHDDSASGLLLPPIFIGISALGQFGLMVALD